MPLSIISTLAIEDDSKRSLFYDLFVDTLSNTAEKHLDIELLKTLLPTINGDLLSDNVELRIGAFQAVCEVLRMFKSKDIITCLPDLVHVFNQRLPDIEKCDSYTSCLEKYLVFLAREEKLGEFLGKMADNQQLIKMCKHVETICKEDTTLGVEVFVNQILPNVFSSKREIRKVFVELAFNLLDVLPIELLSDDKIVKLKEDIQKKYIPKIVEIRVNAQPIWSKLWILLVKYLKTHLHKNLELTNSILRVTEQAFRSTQDQIAAYDCWKALIDNYELDRNQITANKHIKLLTTPLKAKLSRTEQGTYKRMEVWIYLLKVLKGDMIKCLELFLEFAFGPIKDDKINNASNCSKYPNLFSSALEVLLEILGYERFSGTAHKIGYKKRDLPIVTFTNMKKHNVPCSLVAKSVIEASRLLETSTNFKRRDTITKDMWKSFFENVSEMSITCLIPLVTVLIDAAKAYKDLKFVDSMFSALFASSLSSKIFDPRIFERLLDNLSVIPELSETLKNLVTISLNKCTNKTFLVVLPKYFAKNDWKSNLEVAATLWLKLAELCATESFKEIKAEEDMLSFMLAPTFLLHTVIKKEEENILEHWAKLLDTLSKIGLTGKLLDLLRGCLKENPSAVQSTSKLFSILLENNKEVIMPSLVDQLFSISSNLLELPNFTQASSIVDLIQSCLKHNKELQQHGEAILKDLPEKSREIFSRLLIDAKTSSKEDAKTSKSETASEIPLKQSPFTRSSKLLEMARNPSETSKIKVKGSMLSSPKRTPSKKSPAKKVDIMEEKSSDFVMIDSEPKLLPEKMSKHQKEMMRRRKEDIPSLYQDLTQDTVDSNLSLDGSEVHSEKCEKLNVIEGIIEDGVSSVKLNKSDVDKGKMHSEFENSAGRLKKRKSDVMMEGTVTPKSKKSMTINHDNKCLKEGKQTVKNDIQERTSSETFKSPVKTISEQIPVIRCRVPKRKAGSQTPKKDDSSIAKPLAKTNKNGNNGSTEEIIVIQLVTGNNSDSESINSNSNMANKSPNKDKGATESSSPVNMNKDEYRSLCPKDIVIRITSPSKRNETLEPKEATDIETKHSEMKDSDKVSKEVKSVSKNLAEKLNETPNSADVANSTVLNPDDLKTSKSPKDTNRSIKDKSSNETSDSKGLPESNGLHMSEDGILQKTSEEENIRKKNFVLRELSKLKMDVNHSEQFVTKSRTRRSIHTKTKSSTSEVLTGLTPKKRPQSETRNYKSPKTKSATPLNKKNVKKTKANCSLLTTEITTPIEQNSTETTPEIENTETIQIDKDKDNINVTKDTSNQTTSSSLNNNQSSKISPETPQSDTSQTIAITLSTTATNDISTKVETPSTEIKSNTSSPNQPETVTKGKVKNKKKSRRNSWPALNEDTIKDVPKDNGKQTENTSYVSQAKTNTSDSLEMVESSQESFVYVAPVQNTTVGVKTGNVLETSGKDENLVEKQFENKKPEEDVNETLTCDPYASEPMDSEPLPDLSQKETSIMLPKGTSPVKESYKLFTNCFEGPVTKKNAPIAVNFYLEKDHFPSLKTPESNPEVVEKEILGGVELVEIPSDSEDIFTAQQQQRSEEFPKTRDEISCSPVTIHTPTKTKELLDNTVGISPIKKDTPKMTTDIPNKSSEETPNLTHANRFKAAFPSLLSEKTASPQRGRARKMMANLCELRGEDKDKSSPEVTDGRLIYNNEAVNERVATTGVAEILTFTRDLPSPYATPRGGSILKRKLEERDGFSGDGSPCPKRKKVNFSDPPITCQKLYFREENKAEGNGEGGMVVENNKGKKKHGKKMHKVQQTSDVTAVNGNMSEDASVSTDSETTEEDNIVQNEELKQFERFQEFKDYLIDMKTKNDEKGLESAMMWLEECFHVGTLAKAIVRKAEQPPQIHT